MQARHEYKHSINAGDYLLVRSRLGAVLAHDGNVGAQGTYRVRSLYFDTPHDKALREKIDGVDRREKFRLRRYNDDTTYICLEKKSKVKGLCYKEKAAVSAEEVQRLLAGDLFWMAKEGIADERPLLTELYGKMKLTGLKPQVITDYEREPFVYTPGNVRITLDRDLHSSRYRTDFLNNNMALIPAGEVGGLDGGALLEVKYDAFIPGWIAGLVRVSNRRAAAFSKYAASRVYG